jgi:hypothetical protein
MITLNAGAVLTFGAGGATVETDDHAAVTGVDVDWNRNTATLTYSYGTWAAPVFTPGPRASVVTVTVDLQLGGWLSTAGPGGALSPAQLSQLLTALKTARNAAETFAAGPAGNLLPGVTTAW